MLAALEATGVAGAEFTEHEVEALDRACSAADRAEQLQVLYDAELAKGGGLALTTLAKISAEVRHLERQSLQMLDRVKLTADPVPSARHQRAARTRWDRRRRENEADVVGLD